MDRGAWWAAVHGVAKSRTQLNDFTFTFHFQALEKEMATHSSVLAWRDRGAWWAAVYGVSQSWTRLKWLNSSSSSNSRLSVQFSRSVVSDSLRHHEPQHARPPCPSPTPGVYSNSCPSSRWCYPVISSSVVPFSSCSQSLPAPGSFPMSQLFVADYS